MIVSIILAVFMYIITSIFSLFPIITTLPTVLGFDIDAALVNGVGLFNHFANDFFFIRMVMDGALTLFAYYGVKLLLKAMLGSRAPGSH